MTRPTAALVLQAAVIVVNVVIGGLSLAVGVHDMANAEGFWQAGLAGAFAASGIILIGSSLVLFFWRSVTAKQGALYGLLVGCAPGLMLMVLQFLNYDWDARLIVWILAAMFPVMTTIICLRCGLRFPRSSTLTAATFLTAVLSAASLTLTLRPVNQPETLQAEILPKVVGHRIGPGNIELAVVSTTITTKNLSNRRLLYLGSVYNIYAEKVEGRKDGSDQALVELKQDQWSGRFEAPHRFQLVEAGCQTYGLGNFLEPGQQDVTTIVSLVPSQLFNTTYAEAEIVTARADRLRIGAPVRTQPMLPRRTPRRSRVASVIRLLTSGRSQQRPG
jgi:hypothetical protein